MKVSFAVKGSKLFIKINGAIFRNVFCMHFIFGNIFIQ